MADHSVLHFLFEVGSLKKIRRSGWWLAGIAAPESVAEHTFRTAIIGFVLAEMVGADPARTAVLCLFHDLTEARLSDLNHVTKRYIESELASGKIIHDVVGELPAPLGQKIAAVLSETHIGTTNEARTAHDADILECMIQAREYESCGYQGVRTFRPNLTKRLFTSEAKRLAEVLETADPYSWWQTFLEQSLGKQGE